MSEHAYTALASPEGRVAGRARRPGAAGPLGVAGLCLVALALTWVVADLVPATHLRDAVALHDFTLLSRPRVDTLANGLLGLLDPLPFMMWGAALVVAALARGRPSVALAVALVLTLAPLTADTLKPLLAHPHASVDTTHIVQASWPSGHSAAALALVLCALLVTPARMRPAVAVLGALFAAGVGVSLLILAWHLPSDVVGGYLVAATWTALAVAGLRVVDRRRASARPRGRSGGARRDVRVVRARIPQ